MNEKRYTICGDDSGHDYFIEVGQENQFFKWVESFEDDTADDYEGPDFNDSRIDGRFTFTDPRCE